MLNRVFAPVRGGDPPHEAAQLYGPTWAAALASLSEAMRYHAADIGNSFYDHLVRLSGSKHIVHALSTPELDHLKSQQTEYLSALAAPDLSATGHRAMALRAGRVHAVMGIDQEDLIRIRELLFEAIHRYVDATAHGEAVGVLARRLTRDLAWQAEAAQSLQNARQDVLVRITRLAWETDSYTDLIDNVVEILSTHDEVAGCAVGRPDSRGVFRFEAASKNIARFLADLERSEELQITTTDDSPRGQGSIGRAWRSGRPEHLRNFRTDPQGALWKDVALSEGLRSVVAIPLSQPGCPPMAVLILYSALPGGYAGDEQRAFIELLQTLLAFAVARFENLERRSRTVPFAMRKNWTTLLRSDALQMHYQPLLDLKTGRVTKVEALARLKDGDRLLSPAEFFPALSSDDFLELYVRGLGQALSHRQLWLRSGIDLGVSVNLPPSALSDIRYLEATQQAMSQFGCDPGKLTLEMLETDALLSGVDGSKELAKFKALGINLAEDDLGSGHSSLHRLRELPFDWIKIDRSIVSLQGPDALDVLRFIYQLTRLGHSLDKKVIVEGVEGTELLEAIAILGADAAQGYGIARPMPAHQIVAWMGRQPGLRATPNANGPLAKLARLLIQEERLYLISEDQPAFDCLADIVKTAADAQVPACAPSATQDSSCQDCLLTAFFVETESVRASDVADSTLERDFIAATVRHGLCSADYRLARRRLIESIMFGAV
ncbi:EAL domain-containing protein [Paraburkholderia dinghuensis]|uniref:EAL domain-containing protein n=1 Tax=Paraburkholderia dinghuensis TaxID=2305225 RepID=A0A3N6NJV4_9BURK|nr:EAL domain-containing protein [Paraburkholderia dinghuensis]RQH09167.1 EAL domain-containing protein [Paraburkholderia dinghuensis]